MKCKLNEWQLISSFFIIITDEWEMPALINNLRHGGYKDVIIGSEKFKKSLYNKTWL